MLVIIKPTPVLLLWCFVNTQFRGLFKSSSTSQFIKGKSKDLRKLLRYSSGIVTSVFKGEIGGCGGCGGFDPSGFGGGSSSHAGLASVFTIILSYI